MDSALAGTKIPRLLLMASVMSFLIADRANGAGTELSFEADILPILSANCVSCHNATTRQAGLDLSSQASLFKGSQAGPVLTAGAPEKSLLFQRVLERTMPPSGAGMALSDQQIETLRTWILRGNASAGIAVGVDSSDSEDNTAESPLFKNQVMPIFRANCFKCHGIESPPAGLDLRSEVAILRGGRTGPVVVPGSAEKSFLFQRVVSQTMPPPGSGDPLTRDQVDRIRQWIENVTKRDASTPHANPMLEVSESDRKFWAFQKPVRPALPKSKKSKLVRTPIDGFVLSKLESKGLSFSPEASKLVLMRRAYLDLLGIPPSIEEIEAYVADSKPDAYERMIDRLLSSPHYGERWARHWLDVAGYNDETGFANDLRNLFLNEGIWRYRDYVVRSFNEDKSYDRFLTEQLAGDEIVDWRNAPKYTPEIRDALVATGYLRLMQDLTDSDVVNNAPYYHDVLSRVVDNFCSGILGMTGGCARCHDHKYDPIPQQDYYRLVSLFASANNPDSWIQPKNRFLPDVSKPEQQAIESQNAEIQRSLAELQKELATLRGPREQQIFEAKLSNAVPDVLRSDVRAAFETAAGKRSNVQKYLGDKLKGSLTVTPEEVDRTLTLSEKSRSDKLQDKIKTVEGWRQSFGRIEALWDVGKPPKIHILRRGSIETPGPEVEPGFVSVLSEPGQSDFVRPSNTQGDSSGRRLALAHWLTRRSHPLTARVIVNRIWMHHFGRGIVSTPENFGKMGASPSHPELLDWLAVDFMENGWKFKRLHKMIMTSTVYRQSSKRPKPEELSRGEKIDSENALLWRMNFRRMEAEVLRDSILAVSGKLDRTMGGRPVPVDGGADGLITIAEHSTGPLGRWRRSLYLTARRNYSLSFLDVFDFPIMALNCTHRNESATPLQSLTLLNSEFIQGRAREFASRVEELAGNEATDSTKVHTLYLLAFARKPTTEESQLITQHLKEHHQIYLNLRTDPRQAHLRALTSVCQMVMGSNEFLYID